MTQTTLGHATVTNMQTDPSLSLDPEATVVPGEPPGPPTRNNIITTPGRTANHKRIYGYLTLYQAQRRKEALKRKRGAERRQRSRERAKIAAGTFIPGLPASLQPLRRGQARSRDSQRIVVIVERDGIAYKERVFGEVASLIDPERAMRAYNQRRLATAKYRGKVFTPVEMSDHYVHAGRRIVFNIHVLTLLRWRTILQETVQTPAGKHHMLVSTSYEVPTDD